MQSLSTFPETLSCDVFVAGGGVAGVAAAVAAARKGCSVVLAERTERLGGIGTRGMLRSICGLYQNGDTEPAETLNSGMARDIVSMLRERAPHHKVRKIGQVFVLPCASSDLELVLLSLCKAERSLTLVLDCAVTGVMQASQRISGVALDRKGLQHNVVPRAVVDCTGSGEVAFLAGAEYWLAGAEELQLAGVTVLIKDLSASDQALAIKVPYVLAKAVEQGELSPAMRFTTFSDGDRPDEGYLKFSVDGGTGLDREQQVRDEIEKAIGLLRERLPAFQKVSVGQMSGVLPREGRRICGEYVLTEQDVLSARKFPDGVVRNSWPIELWDRSRGTSYRSVPAGDHYEIPFRCLQVKGFGNLLAAGRCISATHAALGSARVMGTCMALGDIAGQAAAELAMKGRYPDFAHS
jgi:hypothetical protein